MKFWNCVQGTPPHPSASIWPKPAELVITDTTYTMNPVELSVSSLSTIINECSIFQNSILNLTPSMLFTLGVADVAKPEVTRVTDVMFHRILPPGGVSLDYC